MSDLFERAMNAVAMAWAVLALLSLALAFGTGLGAFWILNAVVAGAGLPILLVWWMTRP